MELTLSRQIIDNIIKTGYTEFITNFESDTDICMSNSENDLFVDETMMDWIIRIEENSKRKAEEVGNRTNAYYNPSVFRDIMRLMKYVPLWTGIMMKYFGYGEKIVSYARVESDFSDLKKKFKKMNVDPLQSINLYRSI